MVIGSSFGRSIAVFDVCLRREPQYQHTNKNKAKVAMPATIQNRIEKVEVVDKVSVISWGISFSCAATVLRVLMEDLSWLTWSSRCLASLISSEGSVSGLKAQEKRRGSALIRVLWSDRRVWLKSVSEQPGLMWILEVVRIRIG